MKHLLIALVLAFGVVVFPPQANAGCGKCGGDSKPHTHEPGHNHDHSECAGCGKAKAHCECPDKDEALCECGKTKDECVCDKG